MKKCIVPWCSGVQNASGKGYCRKHYDQIRQNGCIDNIRGINDPSEIVTVDNHAEIIIADRSGIEICRAIIDIDDIHIVEAYRWTQNNNGYIRTFEHTHPIYLHRMLLGFPEGYDVDHINRNKLDNRRENLRAVTHVYNCSNRGKTGSVRKITNRNLSKPFLATLIQNGKRVLCKYYRTEEEARDAIRKLSEL